MEFENNIRLIYGEKGECWLQNLPTLIERIAQQWGLKDLIPCIDLTYNYVLKGQRNLTSIVLKIGIDLDALAQEHEALLAFKNHGVISIWEVDLKQGALLLQQAIPGKTLVSLFPAEDDRALRIALHLATRLHQASIPEDHSFLLLEDWLKIIDQPWDLPLSQLQLARKLRDDLLQNSKSQVLLHGDLHYGNILSDGDQWVVIDPKGVIGDPLYDMTGCLLREPFNLIMQQSDIRSLLQRRLEFVAQFTQKPLHDIWAWTYVQTVMSICWSLEDGQDVGRKKEFLEILEE